MRKVGGFYILRNFNLDVNFPFWTFKNSMSTAAAWVDLGRQAERRGVSIREGQQPSNVGPRY